MYAVALHVPPFDGEAEKCASRRRRRRRRRREAERAVSRIRKNSRGAEASPPPLPPPSRFVQVREPRATSAPVVVRDAAAGDVLVNVSMAAAGWVPLGNFT